MKKITIIKTPKQEAPTKDEVDLLFEKYEKSFSIPVTEAIKHLSYNKELKPYEQIIKVDSNIPHTIINEISRFIPLIIVKEDELSTLKIEKIQHVEVITKNRTKCYNYKKETEYYAYDGEKILVVGFFVPSFSELSKIILNELFEIKNSLTQTYESGNYTSPVISLYYSSEFGLEKLLKSQVKIDKKRAKLISDYFSRINSGLNSKSPTQKEKNEVKAGGEMNIIENAQMVLFKQEPMDYIKPVISLLEYLSIYHFSTKLINYQVPRKSFLQEHLDKKYDEFYKLKVGKENNLLDEDLYFYGKDRFLLKILKDYNKNYKPLEELYKREENIRKNIKENLNRIIEEKSVKNELNLISQNRFKTCYDKLTKEQKIRVDKDYENKVSFELSMTKNTCKHVPIYRELSKTNSDEKQKRLLSALMKFIDKKKITSKEFVSCTVCKLNVICPHLLDVFDGVDTKTIITKYASGEQGSVSNYICDICGEEIRRRKEMEGMSTFSAGKMIQRTFKYDDFTELILNEVNYILNTYFTVKYGGYKQMRQLSLLLTDALTDYIDDIEDSIRKAKTMTDEDKRSQLIMYIAVYTFAFLGLQYNKLGIIFKKEDDLLKEIKTEKTIIKADDSKTAVINESSSAATATAATATAATATAATATAATAAAAMAAGGKSSELETHNEMLKLLSKHRTILFTKFNISVVEQYKRALAKISSDKIEIKQEEKTEEIEKIYTDTFYRYLFEVHKLNSLINNQQIPALTDSKKIANADNVIEKGKSIYANFKPLDVKFKDSDIYTSYLNDSYKYITDYVVNRRFDTDYRIIEYGAEGVIEDILSKENQIMEENKKPFRRFVQKFSYLPFKKFYEYPNRGYFYDKTGNRQKYDLVIMKDKSGKTKSFESNKVPINHKMRVIDFKNSKTGDALFNPPKVDKTNIDKKIEYKDFIDYYLFNCPKGEVHDFKNDKCSKCGASMNENFDKKAYYNKYISEFRKINKIREIKRFNPEKITYKEPDKLSCSTTKISNFCKKYKIDYNLVINLGRTEQQDFSDVKRNKLNLELVDEVSRTMKLENYLNRIIIDYYTIVNRKNITDLPKDISKLLDSNPKLNLKNIDEQIKKYRNNMYAYKNTLKSPNLDINNYILNTMVDFMELIPDKNVIKFMFTKIITHDKFFTVARKLSAKQVQKELDEWVKEAEDKSDNKLMSKIEKEDEDAEDLSGDVKASDFSLNFDFEIDDEEESSLIGDL